MSGILYGVGVGPGDPELLTLKAVRIIRECDIIAIPTADKNNCTAYNIVKQVLPEIDGKETAPIDMPMTKDKKILHDSHRAGSEKLENYLKQGFHIAFLTLGDPTVYSTYIYLHKRIIKDGYQAEIINGIPSFCAAAAQLQVSLAEGPEQIHILPGSYPVKAALNLKGTKILMKAGKKLREVRTQLTALGVEASMVENCGMEQEKIYRTLKEIPEEAGYYSLIIVKE